MHGPIQTRETVPLNTVLKISSLQVFYLSGWQMWFIQETKSNIWENGLFRFPMQDPDPDVKPSRV
jgi:hypothetical protein